MSIDDLLTPEEAAEQLDVSARTLSNWRSTGENELPYLKIGRNVRYRQEDIDELLEDLEAEGADSDAGATDAADDDDIDEGE